MTKVEYEKSIEFLESPEKNNKKITKQTLSLKKKKIKKNQINLLEKFKKKDEDLEKITLNKIEKLGEPLKFDNSYFTDGMIKKFRGCNNSFKCKGAKAGQILFKTFNREKSYTQKNPGKMIKAMAMFEVFYANKLWEDRESIERYKKNEYEKSIFKLAKKQADEKKIRSLFGINKGRISMREALGMDSNTLTKEAIKKFWLLGEFLDLGTGVNNDKLAKDLKERQKLLENYKTQIANLKNKLQDDIDDEEDKNENTVE